MKRNSSPYARLRLEVLESRLVPSSLPILSVADPHDQVHPVIVAGDPNGSPTDSTSLRVDANTSVSPFAGVGSVRVDTRRGTYLGTGTPIDATHILTAGHMVDINNDGKSDKKDGILGITFNLNLDVDAPNDQVDVAIPASQWTAHPDFTGFSRPSVNDDLAILTLSTPLPSGVPTYPLYASPLAAGTTLVMVGYGRSGDGINGYTTNASFTIKREGENNADAFYGQDDAGRPAANEVFRFDFDGPTGTGTWGGGTLGNDRETTLGGGDSGGPSFVLVGSSYYLAGVNTFSQGQAPYFGSLGGGIAVYSYLSWIQGQAAGSVTATSSSGDHGTAVAALMTDDSDLALSVGFSQTSAEQAPASHAMPTQQIIVTAGPGLSIASSLLEADSARLSDDLSDSSAVPSGTATDFFDGILDLDCDLDLLASQLHQLA